MTLNQNGTVLANGDALFRSVDGLRSLILARRDFDTWGNVPQSREVQPTLDADNSSLLNWEAPVFSITDFCSRQIRFRLPTEFIIR